MFKLAWTFSVPNFKDACWTKYRWKKNKKKHKIYPVFPH